MITWILGSILIIWSIIRRAGKNGKVEGYPLGMPRGTVRAIITLMVVSFPYTFFLNGWEIQGEIINAIFILAAFYFEARKGGSEKLDLIKEIKSPEEYKLMKSKEKYPLYLPKYSVRITLMLIILSVLIINEYFSGVAFETVNTIFNILAIIFLYFIGTLFQKLLLSKEKKDIMKEIQKIENYQNKSEFELYQKINEIKPNIWKRRWKSFYSLITFAIVVTSLILFQMDIDYFIPTFFWSDISLRNSLLLIINVYYGFRD